MTLKNLFVLWLLACAGLVNAQPVPAIAPVPRVVFPPSVVGNTINLGAATANAANAANFSFGVASNGSVFANSSMNVPTSGGASVLVDVAGRIPKASVIRAIGNFAAKGVPLLSTGIALYDLAKEVGIIVSNDPAGQIVYQTKSSGAPTGCLDYKSFADNANATDPRGIIYNYDHFVAPDICYFYVTFKTNPEYNGFATSRIAPQPPQVQVTNAQGFADALNAKGDYAPTSAIARAVNDAIKSGESVDVVPETITGPVSSVGPKEVTVSPANNTTTTNQTTNNYSYEGSKFSITNTTNSTVVNNATGAVTAGDTVTRESPLPQPKVPPPEIKVCGLTDDTACKIDETGTPNQADIEAKMPLSAADKVQKDINDIAADPVGKFQKHPAINWAFVLPTGCSVIPTPAFEPMLKGIDICQFQPMFHDLMSIVWLFGGLFGAISLFMKTSLAD